MKTPQEYEAEIARLMLDVDIALNLQDFAQKSEADMAIQLEKAEQDAARWRKFTEGPYPICFLGGDHATKASLDAAVDAVIE